MDESNFDRLLERYVTGKVTEQEKRKIEAWFDVRKTRGEENTSLNSQEAEELFKRITSKIDNEEDVKSLRPHSAITRNRTRLVIGIAATIIVFFTVALFLFNSSWMPRSSGSSTERLILNDGTIVWLRGKSKFNYYESDGTRNGTLEGEALFEVAKDPARPFRIRYNDYTITVVGTSFALRTTDDSVEVKVLTGKVRITTPSDSSGIFLERFETATMHAGTEAVKSSFSTQQIPVLIADTQYDMSFSNTTMKEVADRLSVKFNVEFKFSNQQIGNCLVTADFTDHSLESTTAMLADALHASFKRDGKTILIEGSGCD
jgi:transmembrane sensor